MANAAAAAVLVTDAQAEAEQPVPPVRIEYYLDESAETPSAYMAFQHRMAWFLQERDKWATIVMDSATALELSRRMLEKYVLNPKSKEQRQWYAGTTDALEELLCIRLASLPQNVVVIAHVDRQQDMMHGTMIRLPDFPGRLSKRMASKYSEIYHAYVTDIDGTKTWMLQTRPDSMWMAASQIDAPDPAWGNYESLWQPGAEREPIHALIWGDAGGGKSTAAATFPKPMLVFCFDPVAKARPYRNTGTQTLDWEMDVGQGYSIRVQDVYP